MKINVEFDLTPEEFRQSLGLPDVESFQRDLLERIQKQVESGAEGYDPMSLMQPFLQQSGMPQGLTQGLSQGLSSFGSYQQMMLDMLRQASSGSAQTGNEAQGRTQGRESTDPSREKSGQGGKSGKQGAEKQDAENQGVGNKTASEATGKTTASARSRTKRES